MQRFTVETAPPFGDPRLTYQPAHHVQDQYNEGKDLWIDGSYVFVLDYYPEDGGGPPTERDVYNAWIESLKEKEA